MTSHRSSIKLRSVISSLARVFVSCPCCSSRFSVLAFHYWVDYGLQQLMAFNWNDRECTNTERENERKKENRGGSDRWGSDSNWKMVRAISAFPIRIN